MGEVVLIIMIIFGSIAITTLGCVWMGTSYSAKKKGLKKGASQREVEALKCHRLFRPQFRKVKTSFVVEIREVSNTLTLNAGVSGDTLV